MGTGGGAPGRCDGCGRPLGEGRGFELRGRGRRTLRCLGCAIAHPPLLARSAGIALVIGSVLVAINQADVLLGAVWPPALLWKVPLTYLVPFVVATSGALFNSRR